MSRVGTGLGTSRSTPTDVRHRGNVDRRRQSRTVPCAGGAPAHLPASAPVSVHRRGSAHATLIVDDEAPARAKIRRLLTAQSDVGIVGEATTGRDALALIKRTQPDIVFLDIQMPHLDGFGVLDALGRMCAVRRVRDGE